MMPSLSDTRALLSMFSRVAAFMVIAVGVFVMVGWILGDSTLKSVLPSFVSMKPNTALGLILSGTALRLRQEDVRWFPAYPLATVCAALAAAIGLMTIAEYAGGWNWGMDEWLFQDPADSGGARLPGRMGVNTALCLVCFGTALLLLENHRFGPYLGQTLAVAAMGGAFAALIGYAYRSESLYGVASSTPMAVHSSIALIALGVGVLCAQPTQGWMALLIDDGIGSQIARRLLPAAILIPFVNGFVGLAGLRLGFYDQAFGAALVTTSGILVFGALIWWKAGSLNRVDRQRREAERTGALYRQMFMHSNDSIAVIDADGYYVEQNAQHERLLGYATEELRGRTPALYVGELEFRRITDHLAQTESYRGDVLYRTKAGHHVPIELSAFSVRNEKGDVVCRVGMGRDITDRKASERLQQEVHDELERRILARTSALMKTNETLKREVAERKRAEGALQESSAFTQSILDSLGPHIAVVDRDGAIVAVNEAWTKRARAAGAPAGSTGVGMNYPDICRRVLGHDEWLADSMAGDIRALLDGVAGCAASEYESACQIDSETRWFLITLVPHRGIRPGAVISHFDITARKRAEEAVRESEGRFRAIFHQASVGIAEVRPDGRFLRVNAKLCDILGRHEDVLLTMTFQEVTHPEDRSAHLAFLQQALEHQGDGDSIEKRYLQSSGTHVWCRLAVSLVRTSVGSPTHLIVVIEDITERKRTTDALRTIVAATASATEEDFFCLFVSHLAIALGVKYAFIGERLEGGRGQVRTLAVWDGQEYGRNVSYDIVGTPCEQVLTQGVSCYYPHGVQERFPSDAFLRTIGAESYHGLPLLDRAGRVLGLLAVMHDQAFALLPGMEEMLIVLAARAGVELERKRTLAALRFSEQALRQLIEEREQLAQDLHDGIIQSIYAAALGLEESRRLVQEGSPSALAQIRTVIADLNCLIEDVRSHIVRKPREIKNGQQLKLALERLVRVLLTCPEIQIVAAIDRAAADCLLPGEATHVYYIAAEALSNAVRHAHAGHCLLSLRLVRGAVQLEVSDNGCGFDPLVVSNQGQGLRNLSGRAAKLKAQLRLVSSSGCGTRLMIDVPKELRDDEIDR